MGGCLRWRLVSRGGGVFEMAPCEQGWGVLFEMAPCEQGWGVFKLIPL